MNADDTLTIEQFRPAVLRVLSDGQDNSYLDGEPEYEGVSGQASREIAL